MNKQPAPRRSGRRSKVKDERPNMSGCEASAEEETGETEEQEPAKKSCKEGMKKQPAPRRRRNNEDNRPDLPGSSFQDEEQPGTSTDPGKRKRGSSTLERVCTCNECKQHVETRFRCTVCEVIETACKQHVETRFRCTVCEDYDLCITCYSTKRHEHKMEKLGLGLDDESGSSASASTQSPGDSRRLSIQRCIQSLVHACQCRNTNCSLPSCQKMKRVVQHTKGCKRKTNGGCPVCKQLITLCCYHAKHCQENKCPVPFCLNIKHKLRQAQLQHRLQQIVRGRRRMASMQRVGAGAVTGTGAGQPPPPPSYSSSLSSSSSQQRLPPPNGGGGAPTLPTSTQPPTPPGLGGGQHPGQGGGPGGGGVWRLPNMSQLQQQQQCREGCGGRHGSPTASSQPATATSAAARDCERRRRRRRRRRAANEHQPPSDETAVLM